MYETAVCPACESTTPECDDGCVALAEIRAGDGDPRTNADRYDKEARMGPMIRIEQDDPHGTNAETADLWIVCDDAQVLFGPASRDWCVHFYGGFVSGLQYAFGLAGGRGVEVAEILDSLAKVPS